MKTKLSDDMWLFDDIYDDPTEWFIIGIRCDCDDGCEACDYSHSIKLYFNSEPTGHNVIGINERMVND